MGPSREPAPCAEGTLGVPPAVASRPTGPSVHTEEHRCPSRSPPLREELEEQEPLADRLPDVPQPPEERPPPAPREDLRAERRPEERPREDPLAERRREE